MPERYLDRTLGKYRVDALLGSGGFAWVYRGFDPELGIPVALKVLKPQFGGDAEFEARFRREASTAARLRHPNVVTIYAVGREGDAVYFAMDYLPQSLTGRLEVMRVLPAALLVRLGTDVSRALAYAHREGVIHRDVKTDNILFDDHGNAIVADFGIARAVADHGEKTGTNLVVGTPQYFAPEQARGRAVDGRTDIYSLGVTLFHAATGQLPFSGPDWYEIARQHVEEPPPSPRSLEHSLPRGLEAVILRCMEKDPDDRYATADDLSNALGAEMPEFGPGSNARTMSLPAIDRYLGGMGSRRRQRRTRQLMIGGGVIVAIAIAGAALMQDPVGTQAGATIVQNTSPPSGLPLLAGAVVRPQTPMVDSAAVAESLALARGSELRLGAPAGALLSINGRSAGSSGSAVRRGLAPGVYRVAASLPAQEGCPTARVERTVSLAAGETQSLRLEPRRCGLLTLDVEPSDARYTLTSRQDGRRFQGRAPTTEPLLLSAGEYDLQITYPLCVPFTSTRAVVVVAETARRERVRLICG